MTKKEAWDFANSLTTAKLKIIAVAFAEGKSFKQAQKIVTESERDKSVIALLRIPRTGKEIARALRVDKKSAMTYIAKLRRRGFKITTEGKYGQMKYRVLD